MAFIKKLGLVSIFLIITLVSLVSATSKVLDVELSEYVDQEVIFNPLKTSNGIWYDNHENQTYYNLTGFITVTNVNPEGLTISDIYIRISNTTDLSTLPIYYTGRNGTFISDNISSGEIVLHIPELKFGENSTWFYYINETKIRPPLNFTSSYSDTKVLAGDNITIIDTISNNFNNVAYQTDNCLYNINITQITVPVNFSGYFYDYFFLPLTTSGVDASNVSYSSDNKTQYWNVLNGSCLNLGNSTNISYVVSTPYNIPKTTHYKMINTTIRYNLNETISHLRVTQINSISEAKLNFSKKIIRPSHPTLYGSNVTWNVTGLFRTGTNISYNLSKVTLWVSKRNVNGSYTDPNVIDNDSISNNSLLITFNPFVEVNKTNSYVTPSWLFNYSDVPSPIVWMNVNYTIKNDGVQLINRTITRNNNDIYIKEIYLIIGYWLEINKNVTSLGNNTYHIIIDVHNKGNQVTPADTVVMIYDFIPKDFNLSGSFSIASSPWYSTVINNNNISGYFNGTLYQFGLVPTNSLNTSFAAGPIKNENTTWHAEYNVTGKGDYKVTDIYITGLDPLRVDGAGSTSSVVISEFIDKLKGREGVFASLASLLLLISILI